jgi:hypothetical protein
MTVKESNLQAPALIMPICLRHRQEFSARYDEHHTHAYEL